MDSEFTLETFGDWHDADGNADQVRLWEGDLCVAEVTNAYDGSRVTYEVTHSDTFRLEWREECSGYRTWQATLHALFDHETPAAKAALAEVTGR